MFPVPTGMNRVAILGFGAYARVRNNFSISAGQDDWSVMYFNRYIGKTEYLADGSRIDAVLYHNIATSYFITDGLSVSLGVKNLTDEKNSTVLTELLSYVCRRFKHRHPAAEGSAAC